MLQPNSSTRSTLSASSSSSGAGSMLSAGAAADQRQQGRSVLGGPPSAPSRRTPLSASSRGAPAAEAGVAGPRSASPGMLSAARTVNRTPLLNKSAALEPKDDAIVVGPAGLSVLLGDAAGAQGPGGSSKK